MPLNPPYTALMEEVRLMCLLAIDVLFHALLFLTPYSQDPVPTTDSLGSKSDNSAQVEVHFFLIGSSAVFC